MKCNFTFKHYEEILKLALAKGYHFLLFQEEPKKYRKIIYLRHDVDISLDNAIKLAEIEHKHRIKATYFFLLHDIFYNILEKKAIEDIKNIQKSDHQIGLHFDENFNANSKSTLKERVIQELKLMESILGVKATVVSFHNPILVLEKEIKDKRFINVYSNKYFKEIKYLSDSLQNWRVSCPCNVLREKDYEKLQILMHPVLWSKKSLSLQRIINNYMFSKCDGMNNHLKECHRVYRRKLKKNLKKLCPLLED